MSDANAIRFENVFLNYRFSAALKNITFEVNDSMVLGLLGPNGSGKSSILKLIVGVFGPTRGKVSVFGHTPGSLPALQSLSYAPENSYPPEYLTPRDYLNFIADLKKLRKEKLEFYLDFFEIPLAKKMSQLSKGLLRRVVLAVALMGNEKIIILDEPTDGLDPQFILKIRKHINELKESGRVIIYCSHILSEVEKVADLFLILKKGEMKFFGSPSQLMNSAATLEEAFIKSLES